MSLHELTPSGNETTRHPNLAGDEHSLHERFNPEGRPSPVQVSFNRYDLLNLFAERRYVKGAEVGVMTAEYSSDMFALIPGLELRCIDSWAWSRQGEKGFWNTYWASRRGGGPKATHNEHYEKAMAQLAPYGQRAIVMRMLSHEAAALVPDGSLDFVYVDAQHTYEGCLADLECWSPKVRSGGIVAGDDYKYVSERGKDTTFRGVDKAVDEFAPKNGLEYFYTSDTHRVIAGRRHGPGSFGSFFWEKP